MKLIGGILSGVSANRPAASESDLVSGIVAELPHRLGKQFEVRTRSQALEFPIGVSVQPDIMVRDTESGRFALIQVTGSPDTDLPMAMGSAFHRVKEANPDLAADIILVSASRVPDPLKSLFDDDGITVFEIPTTWPTGVAGQQPIAQDLARFILGRAGVRNQSSLDNAPFSVEESP